MKLKTALNEIPDFGPNINNEKYKIIDFVIEFQKQKDTQKIQLHTYQKDDIKSPLNPSVYTEPIEFETDDVFKIKKEISHVTSMFMDDPSTHVRDYIIDSKSLNKRMIELHQGITSFNDINKALATPENGGMWDAKFSAWWKMTKTGKFFVYYKPLTFSQGKEVEKVAKRKHRLFSK